MDTLALCLRPLTAFGSPLLGDTLFGQICWALRRRYGEQRLRELLDGYTDGRPFAIVSDAFPEGFLPRPALPLSAYRPLPDADRKTAKRRLWVPHDALAHPIVDWLLYAKTDRDLTSLAAATSQSPPRHAALQIAHPQPHNSINRLTGTTGRGDFAPYTLMQRWYAPGVALICRVVFDTARIDGEELVETFDAVGISGYGRDATIGLGKFAVERSDERWPTQSEANACLTLAPCAPQGQGFDPRRSFFEVFTRFGRHGDQAVQMGNPFKTPLLLTRAGAVVAPRQMPDAPFVGQGLGGLGQLSKVIPGTVHQGYAPCVPIHLPEEIV